MKKDLLRILDLSDREILSLIASGATWKRRGGSQERAPAARGEVAGDDLPEGVHPHARLVRGRDAPAWAATRSSCRRRTRRSGGGSRSGTRPASFRGTSTP